MSERVSRSYHNHEWTILISHELIKKQIILTIFASLWFFQMAYVQLPVTCEKKGQDCYFSFCYNFPGINIYRFLIMYRERERGRCYKFADEETAAGNSKKSLPFCTTFKLRWNIMASWYLLMQNFKSGRKGWFWKAGQGIDVIVFQMPRINEKKKKNIFFICAICTMHNEVLFIYS